MTMLEKQLQEHLTFIYGPGIGESVFEVLQAQLADFQRQYPELKQAIDPTERVTETDAMLITYGDQLQEPAKPTLQSLAEVLDRYLKGVISSVHLLPFYPYSSDDGFSVIDYTAVNPALGDWPDLGLLRQNFRLMFDAVINHISAQSGWFQGFLAGDSKYETYFITVDPAVDLSGVTRPRTSPLLTPVETAGGLKHVWTTFSTDQIDLNHRGAALLRGPRGRVHPARRHRLFVEGARHQLHSFAPNPPGGATIPYYPRFGRSAGANYY